MNTETWLHPEEFAYNTYSGAHTGSRRRGRALFPDGRYRLVTAGVADTYFTVPCHARVHHKYVSGHLTCDDNGVYHFHHSGAGWHGLLSSKETD